MRGAVHVGEPKKVVGQGLQDIFQGGRSPADSFLANTARDTDKRQTPFKPDEFMRQNYLSGQEEEPVNLLDKARAIFSLFGVKKEK
jgi:hypothetical protein